VTPAELLERLSDRFDDGFVSRDEITVITDRASLLEDLAFLKSEAGLDFDYLADVSATDWPGRELRFWLAYHLYSIAEKHRICLKVGLAEDDAHAPTITELFPGANFMEREVYDMFGVVFDDHPDLRRILLPEDWTIHPQRKDEELGGVRTQYKGAFVPPVDQRLH
jgi:NADH-quinone oxidoreductase subunit C